MPQTREKAGGHEVDDGRRRFGGAAVNNAISTCCLQSYSRRPKLAFKIDTTAVFTRTEKKNARLIHEWDQHHQRRIIRS